MIEIDETGATKERDNLSRRRKEEEEEEEGEGAASGRAVYTANAMA